MKSARPTVVAVIPARSGSKGLPHKNIKIMNGKPLMVWSIEQAIECEYIDDVIVSTDSKEYAQIAKESGALVPFLRPGILANDTATSFDVINHAINYLKENGRNYDILILLEPTSPLRNQRDIQNSLEAIFNKEHMSVVSVCEVKSSHPKFMFRRTKNKQLSPYIENNNIALRRQEVEQLYYLDGNIYASWVDNYINKKTFCSSSATFITTPELRSFEIDDENDFNLVELIHRSIQTK